MSAQFKWPTVRPEGHTAASLKAAFEAGRPPPVAPVTYLQETARPCRHCGRDRSRAAVEADPPPSSPQASPAAVEAGAPAKKAKADQGPTHAEIVAAHVAAHYTVRRTPEGQAFAIPRSGPQLAISLGSKGGAMRNRVLTEIYERSGQIIGSDALGSGISISIGLAERLAESSEMHLRVANHPGRIVLDLGRPNDASCVVVTAAGWTIEANAPHGVYFRRPSSLSPLPTPTRGGSLEPLRRLLGLSGRQWDLVRGWLVCSLRAEIARPLLLFLGPAGSGKTNRGRLVINVLDPRDELGGSFGRNLDDDRVQAASRYLVGFDNLSSVSDAVSDHLCRFVTGDASEKRKLYSDDDSVVLSYRRTGVLTAVTLPSLRADALERLVPLILEPMAAGQRHSEAELRETFEASHPGILGAVLDGAVAMLARLDTRASHDTRNLDYWQGLRAYDPACAEAYAGAAVDVLVDAAESDPFVMTVRSWLERTGPVREVTPMEGYDQLSSHGRSHPEFSLTWWPKGARALSAALTKASGPLAAVGVRFTRGSSNGAKFWLLELRASKYEARNLRPCSQTCDPAGPNLRPCWPNLRPCFRTCDPAHLAPDLRKRKTGSQGSQVSGSRFLLRI